MSKYITIVRGKGVYDDCKSIDAMIEALHYNIRMLEGYKRNGVKLDTEQVCDDYAFVSVEDKAVADRFGFNEDEEDGSCECDCDCECCGSCE